MKKITILGSTGSVGSQALDIIRACGRYDVFAIACNKQDKRVFEQALIHKPKFVVAYDEYAYDVLKVKLEPYDIKVLKGMEGLVEVATHPDVDIVLTSVVGNIGLLPTVKAIEAGKTIALANKETLVTAGELIMPLAARHKVSILPVDSEHSAIFQCLNGEHTKRVEKILLTASGGAFRNYTQDEIRNKKAIEALKHPNWSMGRKITIDSATLMNKGLELIEAKWLFDVNLDQIEVVIHPQSIIHSMVQFEDASVMAQMSTPDMKLPIIYALDYPERHLNHIERVDFFKLKELTFSKPDTERFPCLDIAKTALNRGGIMPTVMNAANEILVQAYLEDRIKFYDISDMVLESMDQFKNEMYLTIDKILEVDLETRRLTLEMLNQRR
ncbi:1-deoxy-D-xylulose-5-phosphate reductoisomerase [Fusibacter ferrireducens]|uniref:1-deoxy-D-xylulose 5-phosphate reductoisomerase n=1 Tax=Fusibacter ferrireducens TaxID=2785058 RepID=A0ABR9ZMS5_9FIRM|nr:1-deoxy-D-xylulose-5-phosphate reductoisomerase [Fusibacter ferrireducens]MBF4691763.1 1-deoxy-D-xylulose-5-phosphate reductoisomerase [Fusibacter ferrireducens]